MDMRRLWMGFAFGLIAIAIFLWLLGKATQPIRPLTVIRQTVGKLPANLHPPDQLWTTDLDSDGRAELAIIKHGQPLWWVKSLQPLQIVPLRWQPPLVWVHGVRFPSQPIKAFPVFVSQTNLKLLRVQHGKPVLTDFPVPSQPVSISAHMDADNDGVQNDLIVHLPDKRSAWLRTASDGEWHLLGILPPIRWRYPWHLHAVDLDGDGNLEAIYAERVRVGRYLQLLLRVIHGGGRKIETVGKVGDIHDWSVVAFVDGDGDGRKEIVIVTPLTRSQAQLRTYWFDEKAKTWKASATTNFAAPSGLHPTQPFLWAKAVDLNGDGRDEVVVFGAQESWRFWGGQQISRLIWLVFYWDGKRWQNVQPFIWQDSGWFRFERFESDRFLTVFSVKADRFLVFGRAISEAQWLSWREIISGILGMGPWHGVLAYRQRWQWSFWRLTGLDPTKWERVAERKGNLEITVDMDGDGQDELVLTDENTVGILSAGRDGLRWAEVHGFSKPIVASFPEGKRKALIIAWEDDKLEKVTVKP